MVATSALVRPHPPAGNAEELVGALQQVMQSVLRRAHPALDAEGISMGQFWALHLVSSLQSASLSTVARRLSVSAPTVCAKVDDLERAGLITRHRSERDRRTVVLSLTPKGRKVEARIWNQLGQLMGRAASDLSSEEIATAIRVFRTLHQQLDASDPRGGGDA
jgi:DNA-binding MarR family transcriptional regulator